MKNRLMRYHAVELNGKRGVLDLSTMTVALVGTDAEAREVALALNDGYQHRMFFWPLEIAKGKPVDP